MKVCMLSKPLTKFKMWGFVLFKKWGRDSGALPCLLILVLSQAVLNLISGIPLFSATKTLNQEPKSWKELTLTSWRRFYPRKTCMCLMSHRTEINITAFNREETTAGYNIKGWDTLEYISLKGKKTTKNIR